MQIVCKSIHMHMGDGIKADHSLSKVFVFSTIFSTITARNPPLVNCISLFLQFMLHADFEHENELTEVTCHIFIYLRPYADVCPSAIHI